MKRKIIPKPTKWSNNLIKIVSHFLFDGYPKYRKDGFVYCSKNLSQVNQMKAMMQKVFHLKPSYTKKLKNGVIRIEYNSVELFNYIHRKQKELFNYLPNASFSHKRNFLRTFFDDEGNVYWGKPNIRRVRGYQKSIPKLKFIQKLLDNFGIESYIDEKYYSLCITGQKNLLKFKNKISFSSKIYLNPNRKNTLWRFKIDKRAILDQAINSYRS